MSFPLLSGVMALVAIALVAVALLGILRPCRLPLDFVHGGFRVPDPLRSPVTRVSLHRCTRQNLQKPLHVAVSALDEQTRTVNLGGLSVPVEVYDVRPPLEAGAGERWRHPGRAGAKELHVLREVMQADEVAHVLHAIGAADFRPEAEGSKNPVQTPTVILKAQGRWSEDPATAALTALVTRTVEQRVVPYLQMAFGDPSVAAAEVLLRRYKPSERQFHPLHFDHHAAATCVVDLTPLPQSGLFLQPGPSAASRFMAPVRNPGDAAVHTWDVFHGVTLSPGHERVSLIIWAKPQGDAQSGEVSWYNKLGAAGDVDAAYRLGMQAEAQQETERAMQWFSVAAAGGHWMAMSRLGRLRMTQGATAEGLTWTERAAYCGWADAQVDAGDAKQRAGDHAAALAFYRSAAAQYHPGGLHRLGMAQLSGWGTPVDRSAAQSALEYAAQLGWADAQFALAQNFAIDESVKRGWLTAAAQQGHPAAANSLAIDASKQGRHTEARSLFLVAANKGHLKAMVNLGTLLQHGVGGPADPAAAERWLGRAKQLGALPSS